MPSHRGHLAAYARSTNAGTVGLSSSTSGYLCCGGASMRASDVCSPWSFTAAVCNSKRLGITQMSTSKRLVKLTSVQSYNGI